MTKLCYLLRRLVILMAITATALGANAQSQSRLTLNVQNAPLKQVLKDIESQTDYRFSFKDSNLENSDNITLNCQDTPTKEVLDRIFKDSNLTYEIVSPKSIVIVEKNTQKASDTKKVKSGVQKTITGDVRDKSGEPLIGATIKDESNPSIVSVTNVDGNFILKNVTEGEEISVSFIGYAPYTFKVGAIDSYNVVLEPTLSSLDEVVVVGYGVQKKVNVTGAVSMVGDEVFKSRPVANVQSALQGAIPGLNLSQTNSGGELNSSMSMNIRGIGTIGDGSVANPLVLIDGIEGNLNTLNPNDIESVSVLKDAAASSIYGSRAAFGVILVTTKSGSTSGVRVSYSGDVRFSTATQLPKMVNSVDWAHAVNAGHINQNGFALISDETIEKMQKYINGEYTDPSSYDYYGTMEGSDNHWTRWHNCFANTNWFDEYYKKNVPSTQHNISLSGGNDQFNWLISGSYLLQNGLMRHGKDQNNRYTTNAKIGARLAPWARVDYNMKWTRVDYERPVFMESRFYHDIARRWPNQPVIDPNGNWLEEMLILELEEMGQRYEKSDMMSQQIRFTFTPLSGWNIIAEGALRTNNNKTQYGVTPVSYTGVNGSPLPVSDSGYGITSYAVDERNRTNYYSVNIFTDYSKSVGKNNFKILAGFNYEKLDTDGLQGKGYNMIVGNKPYISQTQENFMASDSYFHRSTAGYFGRLNYDYDGKYLFEANIRYDGSSRFLSNRRWEWFPSLSAGWNVAREEFMQSSSTWLNTLKPRLSWGRLGNTSSAYSSFWDWYPFYQQQVVGNRNSTWIINGESQNTAQLPSIVNSTMTWETIETFNVGIDWGLFNYRLTGSFDWFVRNTKNMIGPAPVLGSILGADAPKTNNCDMRGTGWELELGWNDRIGKVTYNARVTLSDSHAKVTNYPYDGEFENQSITGWYNGKQDGEIWGYITEGLAQSNEQMESWLKNNAPTWGTNWGAGDVMYRDLSGDGAVSQGRGTIGDHGDYVVIGNSTPRYRIGIGLGLEWNGIDFSAFFQGVLKRDYMFGTQDPYFWGIAYNIWQNCVFQEHLDYWTEDNLNAYYPKPYSTDTKNQQSQSRYLQDASYLRCKNMQLGYSLPTKLIKHAGMTNCRIYVSVDNLFTITKMSSVFDPEVLGGQYGTDGGKTYPLQRTWSVGVSLSF